MDQNHQTTSNSNKIISIIIPCFNDENNLKSLYDQLSEILKKINYFWEILLINDGSNDQTWNEIKKLHAIDPRVHGINFSRNFGHQYAITAGLDFCNGDAAIIMDSDLQDPPELISEMVHAWEEGFQIIYAIRKERQGESFLKIWSAKICYWLLNRLSQTKLPQEVGEFRLIDKSVIRIMRQMREQHRYMRGLTIWTGFKQSSIPFSRKASIRGSSGYNWNKLISLFMDAAVSFSTVPLRLSFILGLFLFITSLISIAILITLKFTNKIMYIGWTSLFIGIIFFSSIQMLILGIFGEYIGRIYEETKKRPLYIVQDSIGLII